MEQIGDVVLAAILVANGELSLHVEHFPDTAACQARIEALKAEGRRVHHADCTDAEDLGLAAVPDGGKACFIFDGKVVCD